ncbi:MAG: tetratricopeptide repeat protein [Tepidisphaeraceae bacterium]|jgi:predicted O-linked N-acetylglucosamine transferase (SPINDLY family)
MTQPTIQRSLDLLRRAVAADPGDAEAHNNLGSALTIQGQLDDAIAAFRRAIALKPNFPQAFNNLGSALTLHGKLEEAIAAYRQAIALKPDLAEAHCNLGSALSENGQFEAAILAFRDALALKPSDPETYYGLANALKETEDYSDAIAAYRQAIALAPDDAEIFNDLGIALKHELQFRDAIAAYRRAVTLNPEYAEAHYNLGIAYKATDELDEAIVAFRQAIALNPNLPAAYSNLGGVLKGNRQLDEAIAAYEQAIELKPDYAEAYCDLGAALWEKGQTERAITALRTAVAARPDFPEAFNNLGNVLKAQRELDQTIDAYRRAIALKPDFAGAFSNLGSALSERGETDEAIAAFRQAVALDSGLLDAHSNLIFSLHYHPAFDAKAIAEELQRWNRRHVEALGRPAGGHSNSRDPGRRLRIGYVSPDFREHPVGRALLLLLSHHDRRQFEVTCYSNPQRPDAITRLCEQKADRWRDIEGRSDDEVVRQIRADQIDILIDLALHTGGNRLLVFARKPAPVQVAYLGYPGTTGLRAIDYRLSDPFLDPPGTDVDYTEKTYRLAHTSLCWQWNGKDVSVGPPQARTRGFITFGCLNNFCKVTPQALQTWGELMSSLPNSRLILRCPPGSASQRVLATLARCGIDATRVELIGRLPWDQYVDLYHRIDISLDPFPYCGHTTSLDSLWMGVPLVTLSGQTAVGRGGRSILSNLNLPHLIAYTRDEYMRIVAALAGDLDQLDSLRRTLRSRLLASPLMDADAFTRDIESAYRQMWRSWCEAGSANG